MNEYQEFKGKTVDEAITNAILALETTTEHLDYEVLSKGSTGFFGIGAKPAVIKARKKNILESGQEGRKQKAVKKDSKDFSKSSQNKEKDKTPKKKTTEDSPEKQIKKEQTPKSKPEKDKSQKLSQEKPVKVNSEKANQEKETATVIPENNNQNLQKKEDIVSEQPCKKSQDKEEVKPDYNKKKEKTPSTVSKESQVTEDNISLAGFEEEDLKDHLEKKHQKEVVQIDVEALVPLAVSFLQKVFGAMEMQVTIDARASEEINTMEINLSGEDMGILIGKRGQTLDSLQYLTSIIVNAEQSEYIRVKVDTENYRNRRRETLENLAKNISSKVRRTNKSVALEPMNPYERRIIHSALQKDKYVDTHSEGEEPYRKVVVTPNKNCKSYNNYNRKSYGNNKHYSKKPRHSENKENNRKSEQE